MKAGRVFVDSNIWLYAFSPRPDDVQKAALSAKFTSGNRIVISAQVINEVAFNLLRKYQFPEAHLLKAIGLMMEQCECVNLSAESHKIGSKLRVQYKFSFWDSLIVAAALEAEAAILYSEDMQHGLKVGKTLRIVNPFL